MNNKPKKATDILLENQRDISEILAIVKNYENNSKVMINSINQLVQRIDAMESNLLNFIRSNSDMATHDAEPTVAPTSVRTRMPGIKPGVVLNINNQEVVNDIADKPEDTEAVPEQIEVATQQIGRRRGDRTPEDSAIIGKLPVKQKVLYQDGKNVCLANVEVFTYVEQGRLELLHKCRTNSAGRWSALLHPGTFLVKIQKSGTNVRPSFDASYTINIPENAVPPVELEPYKS